MQIYDQRNIQGNRQFTKVGLGIDIIMICIMPNKLTKILQYNIQILLQKLCYFHWLLSKRM